MHRVIRDHLEQVLADAPGADVAREHLQSCQECRVEIQQMRAQSGLLHTLRSTAEIEPRAGFYARVMERIEAQAPVSIWNVFSDSPFGRRIAVASMALALAIGVYMFSAEPAGDQGVSARQVEFVPGQLAGPMGGEDQPGVSLTTQGAPDRDAVLVNLVTYQEQ